VQWRGGRLAQAAERAAGEIQPGYQRLEYTPYLANFSGGTIVPGADITCVNWIDALSREQADFPVPWTSGAALDGGLQTAACPPAALGRSSAQNKKPD
jgi:hypothetical protein